MRAAPFAHVPLAALQAAVQSALPAEEVVETLRLDLLFKLALAVILGGAIGLERELNGKPAGLRTNILICVGSALLMDLSINVGMQHGVRYGDPGRIAAQVVSGIGFLGAGTIMQAGGAVIGLTTAATIWTVAAIGLTVGAGNYLEGSGAALLVTVVLAGLGNVEKKILQKRRTVNGTIRVSPGVHFETIAYSLGDLGVDVSEKKIYDHPEDRTFEVRLTGRTRQLDLATSTLMRRNDVLSVQLD